ncbi:MULTISPECIES: hypothetical protein [Rhizobium/Agrobacterium group]|uniref:hypothetical protein n=1 Tax=Rhizobium/Agrobacterium group TaxID=227290 RepID=UPI001571ECDA|nr:MULTISPECIES: hypothetical protein [Rhizobium/Agrobacterium group]MCZ7466403.1 hypothetical protein [Rhizobium rhizogenes]NTD89526.1 hypothetical protein [Agrobacterium tumefaciens]NTD93843.1 hypothetical protein [Agrobacterium tumefaciens]NTE03951.1 hypothetical protein [Agrobacterium tumefaciens]NTE12521.1 hypothetical protein [Agrobacterium tumefaciens]
MDITKQRLEGMQDGLDAFESATSSAVAISSKNIGVVHTGRQNRALLVFAKLIAHNMSLNSLVRTGISAPPGASLMDHFSAAALGRASIDAALMVMYLTHPPLSVAEWNLRRHVLYLHDATNRKRFLDALVKAEGDIVSGHMDGYREAKMELQAKIRGFGAALGLPEDTIVNLSSGSAVFVAGVRGAVDEAGWNKKAYEAHQSYFSAFVHSHPVSFMRAVDHEISFSEPSEYQKYLCNYVLETVAVYTEMANERMEETCMTFESDPLGHIE